MPRRKPPARELTKTIEQQFARDILKLMTPARQLMRAMKAAERQRNDALGDSVRDLSSAITSWLQGMISDKAARAVAERQMKRVERFGRLDFERWSEMVGIDPREAKGRAAVAVDAMMENAILESMGYIKDIPVQLAQQVSDEFSNALLLGQRGKSLATIFEERLGVAESRAKLIARDQSTKALGNMQKARQQALGVTRYEWVTAGDERVRPSHAALNGKVFDWNDPPPEGHPGEPVACRCVAAPILDD